jgi:hypothetical protein
VCSSDLAAGKNKKVNRLNAKEVLAKIEDIEKTSHTGSKYYTQLLQRKRELGI